MYSFEPSDEQKMLIDSIQRFAINDLRAAGREADEKSEFPQNVIHKGWELGLLQASIPEQYGGFGDYSALTGVLAAEELAFGDLAGALAVLTPGLFALPLLLAGSEEQKAEYLSMAIEADWQPYTSALIEPRFDFDPKELQTRATASGDTYLIDGEKTLVPYANDAELLIVYANLEGKTQGFVLPTSLPGFEVETRQPLMGIRGLPVYKVCLHQARVPRQNRLGGPQGHEVDPILDASRVAVSALAVGLSRAAFEYARDYAKEREAFGVKIAQKQAIAFMLAEMATEIEAIRLLTWEAAWMLDNHRPEAGKQAYLAATGAADMAMMVTDRAVQILGGHGYIREHPVEMWMRAGRGISAFTGLAMV